MSCKKTSGLHEQAWKILALVPSFLVSIYVFGARVILLTLVCVVASVGFEWLYNKAMKKRQTAGDLSAALTGVLIAFNVPSNFPYWMAIIGCFVAIIIVKQCKPCDYSQNCTVYFLCHRNDYMAFAAYGRD